MLQEMVNKLRVQISYHRTCHPKQEMLMMRKKLFHMQVINSNIMNLWELMLINMAINILIDLVIGAKAIPQVIVLLLATPLEIVKIKNMEGTYV